MDARYNLGDDTGTTPPPDFSSNDWLSSLTSVAQTYLSIDQQKNLDSINASRAAQGLPPINTAAYASGAGAGYVPVEISPTMILIGVVALVALLR